ncbi:uncharacterized protein LOC133351636 [Lethenteron reissneri]|uniref:uncharacterized protein LOC133351636 n=1 Tax=Lethenteron reissneri TaxID=7753 RepID=UPI002AB7192A|nr:uncharacterized protein LOC133351636 [Lethenteron reissneri]
MERGHGDSRRGVLLHARRPGFGVEPASRSSAVGGAARLGEPVSPWLSARSVSRLQERACVDTRRSRAATQPVLDSEEEFARQVRAYLAHEEVMRVRRAELSLARWEERARREMSAGPGAQRVPGPGLSSQREMSAGPGEQRVSGSRLSPQREMRAGPGEQRVSGPGLSSQREMSAGPGEQRVSGSRLSPQREMRAGPGEQRVSGSGLNARRELRAGPGPQRELHARYLAHVGEKGFVFLDSFDPWEYDPFALSPRGRAVKQRFTSACPRLGHARRGATCST